MKRALDRMVHFFNSHTVILILVLTLKLGKHADGFEQCRQYSSAPRSKMMRRKNLCFHTVENILYQRSLQQRMGADNTVGNDGQDLWNLSNNEALWEDMDFLDDQGVARDLSNQQNKAPFEDVTMSPEYTTLCQAQFEVLKSLLNVDRCELYLRSENPQTGALEFSAVAVYPEKRRRWVVGDNGEVEADGPRELRGFTQAISLIPQYPFVSLTGDQETCTELGDGALSAHLEYNGMVIGILVVWKDLVDIEHQGQQSIWDEKDCTQLKNIASTLAVAAVLDQKERWSHQVQLESLRTALAESLHQVKNPLTALRTFGKLLLRRLPSEDNLNRELAKDIMIQSDRLVDLLLPVDSMITTLGDESELAAGTIALAALTGAPTPVHNNGQAYTRGRGKIEVSQNGGVGRMLSQESSAQLIWVDEALGPILSAATAVAERDGIQMTILTDDDMPGVFINERCFQEAFSNIIDNALKYVLLGGEHKDQTQSKESHIPAVVVRISATEEAEQFGGKSGVVVEVIDNGPGIPQEEMGSVYSKNFRGSITRSMEGSGLGLGIAQDLMLAVGGEINIESQEKVGTRVSLFVPRKEKYSFYS
eukprot:CAMPEP_0117850434 /NCGR_PEP_ID=MMETSP0949-20121206/21684_1 /TAXON_ID=44440 /ORGANISM="Chattonella subsalsa, Strain CCMP2191" /LENGTH=591 /DNA_ID=CAMNT_0005697825 /DNA_START=217 /DNA_END=1992 /DNA_ORIENTATION=+